MTRCLTDIELQAVADGEGDARLRSHADACDACRARVEEARRDVHRLGAMVDRALTPPSTLEWRVRTALHARRPARGATTLHTAAGGDRGRGAGALGLFTPRFTPRRAWLSGLAAAALAIVGAFVVWPSVTRESTLSAAAILGRSLDTFADTTGVEYLEYDLRLEGAATRALGAEAAAGGALRVQQVIDHDHPGRYRVVSLGADGRLLTTMAQDPARGLRTGRIRSEDDTFFFAFQARSDRPALRLSPPQVQRAWLRTVVAVMQATADQKLTMVDEDGATYYAIHVPPVAVRAPPDARAEGQTDPQGSQPGEQRDEQGAAWELSEAHARVRASDFLLKELRARGTVLDQPFGVSFTLVKRELKPADRVADAEFEIQPDPADITLDGEATDDPLGDVVRAALKALGKARQ